MSNNTTVGGGSNAGNCSESSELERIQRECASMINTLKDLHEEERQLKEANENFAHRALLMGCTAGLDGGTRRGARRKAAAAAMKLAAEGKDISSQKTHPSSST